MGLLGANGAGKSTLLKLLADKQRPNFGSLEAQTADEIIQHFRGNESQGYFTQLYQGELMPAIKPQHIDHLGTVPQLRHKTVQDLLSLEMRVEMDLEHLAQRTVEVLSGGELQRLAIGMVGQKAGQGSRALMFDEPTNYLDIAQRVKMARYIHSLADPSRYIIVCDHDLSILDYITDFIHLFMGQESAYGIISQLYPSRQAINIYLDGYSPADNMRFRTYPITFRPPQLDDELKEQTREEIGEYSDLDLQQGSFTLHIRGGQIRSSEVVILLGQNGAGKTSQLQASKDCTQV